MKISLQRSLLFETKEKSLEALDELARQLWLGGLTNSQGTLEPRLEAIAALHRALLGGAVPLLDSWGWPPFPIAQPFFDAITQLDLAKFCSGQKEITDTVMMSLLFHVDFIVDYQDRGANEFEAVRMAAAAFVEDWSERCGQFLELVEVFGLMPYDGKSICWDQIHNLLRSPEWQDVLRISRMLDQIPELAQIIHALGRCHLSEETEIRSSINVEVISESLAQCMENNTVHIPDMPGETRGIYRSDRIARMLPMEAYLLVHPHLRLVWHARRAERSLLSYEEDDRMEEVRLHQARVSRPRPSSQPGKRQMMGPILVCVDTSGSMKGGAEEVAKAVVLEAMRTAHAEHRPCYVFAFGSSDELIEMELTVDSDGINALMQFLRQGFRGGTDICGPLETIISKIEDQQWQLADLLIASDGEFGATPELSARLAAVKLKFGLRVQGILIGDRETIGFMEIADNIFPIREWRRYSGLNVDSPIPSHRLTAMYFPGALRNEDIRKSTVTGDVAAAKIRGRSEPS